MAIPGYMTITGKTQGLISAGCSTPDSVGNKYQSAHTDEIMVLSYSHNLANIDNTRRATHAPIIVTKNVDKSSPLLAQALATREEINCTINFYRPPHKASRKNTIPSRSTARCSANYSKTCLTSFCITMPNLRSRWLSVIAASVGYITSPVPPVMPRGAKKVDRSAPWSQRRPTRDR